MAALHAAIRDVCQLASEVEADADRFPEDWLFHYRWAAGLGGSAGAVGSVACKRPAFLGAVLHAAVRLLARLHARAPTQPGFLQQPSPTCCPPAPPRWGKGNGQKSKMPSGHVIDHLTVGGRTSAVVPALQKASWGAVELVAAES